MIFVPDKQLLFLYIIDKSIIIIITTITTTTIMMIMNMMMSRQPKQALEPVHLTKFEAVNNNVQQVLMIIMMRAIMKVMMIIKMIIMMIVMMINAKAVLVYMDTYTCSSLHTTKRQLEALATANRYFFEECKCNDSKDILRIIDQKKYF